MALNKENAWKMGLHDNNEFMGGLENLSQKELDIKLDERVNLPTDNKGNKIIYKNEHFHCSDKGCDIEMRLVRTTFHKDYTVHKYCFTHNKDCSRTGWELGWFGGIKVNVGYYQNGQVRHTRSLEVVRTKKGIKSVVKSISKILPVNITKTPIKIAIDTI